MMTNPTLGRIFVTGFILFLILPLAFLVVFFLSRTYATSKESIQHNQNIVAESVASNINSKIESPYFFLSTASETADVSSFTEKQIEEMLASGIRNNHLFQALYTLDNEKRVTYINLDKFSGYDKNDFLGIKISDVGKTELKTEWSRPQLSPVSNSHIIRISTKYKDGYIVGDLGLDFIRESVRSISGKNSFVYVVDASGDVIYANVPNHSSMNLSEHPLMKVRKAGNKVVFGYWHGGSKYAGTIHRINLCDWYIIYEQPVIAALGYYRQILIVTVVTVVLLTAFSLLVLYFIRIKLIIPIHRLTEKSKMIAKGNYIESEQVDKTAFRELKTLYDSFEKMALTIDRREKELKDKEEYLRSVFDSTTNTGIIVVSLDKEPVVLDANRGTQIIFGYKMPEILGLPAAGLVSCLTDDITLMCSESRVSCSMVTKRIEMIKKNGTVFPALCTISPLLNFSGKLQGFIGVFMDITEITLVQNELEREKERLDVTLKSIGEGVVAADRYGRITLVNSSAETILGQKFRFLAGHSATEAIQVYDYETGKSITDKLADFSDNSRRTYRANMVTKDAGVITVFITSSVMFDQKGLPIGSVYVFRDISERMKMEQELIGRKQQLEEINKSLEKRITEETLKRRKNEQMLFEQAKFAAMGQMINAIAHQWRQPLNALALYVQDIEDAYDLGDVDKEYLDAFTINAMRLINHMSGTIDDFRNFFHAGNTVESVEITDIIFESLSLVATQIKSQMINYSIAIKDGNIENLFTNRLPESIEIDHSRRVQVPPSELKQVILNILQNARYAILEYRKSNPDKKIGNIDITIYYREDRLKLDIANDGGRIPEDVLGRIFDPYFTTKPEGEGTGIGLYMSKIMVEEHMDGLLLAENRDAGAVFSITLSYARDV